MLQFWTFSTFIQLHPTDFGNLSQEHNLAMLLWSPGRSLENKTSWLSHGMKPRSWQLLKCPTLDCVPGLPVEHMNSHASGWDLRKPPEEFSYLTDTKRLEMKVPSQHQEAADAFLLSFLSRSNKDTSGAVVVLLSLFSSQGNFNLGLQVANCL